MSKKTLRLARVKSGIHDDLPTELRFESLVADHALTVEWNDLEQSLEKLVDSAGELLLRKDGRSTRVFWHRLGSSVYLATGGRHYRFDRVEASAVEAAVNDASHADIKAPMTGKIVKVAVSVGDTLKEGDTVLIVEAMKMEHELKAPFDAVVETLDGEEGAQVDLGQILARLARVQTD
ncbi:MAG: biotin/lipoyl-containing protein [Planctomycetota bacterium]